MTRGIDRVGLGALADRFGEGADLGRIGDCHRYVCCRERERNDDAFETSGGFQHHEMHTERSQPFAAAAIEPGRVALAMKHSPPERTATSRRPCETSIPTMILSIATRPLTSAFDS